MSEGATREAIEALVRDSYGRLVAYLAARSGDIAGAEDALSDALLAALERWPSQGVPRKPEAWLLQAARNRTIDAARRRKVRVEATETVQQLTEEAQSVANQSDPFPDERLKLLFVCAHPAIDVAARTPLMLQTVLGLDAQRIASAFLVSPDAMGQRLVRAKTKIRAAGVPFSIPESNEWPERIEFVLDAIYSAYTTGWDSINETDTPHRGLTAEAIQLARTLVQLMPGEPEVRGLLALMLHCEARQKARVSATGEFVPLDRQDTTLWSRSLIEEAEEQLRVASARKRMGRYQLEAAIQSMHAHRAVSGEIDWEEIALLYEGLVRIAPRIGLLVGRAVALAEAFNAKMGLAALEALAADERVATYQPYWAARAHVFARLGKSEDAKVAFERAASLTEDARMRRYLLRRADGM
jgi:RNA polymerase sigma-70 factor (ECF subfamily)